MKKILLFELCLLFLATNFQSDNPPGWYQQNVPVNKTITDIFFTDSVSGWAVTSWSPQFDTGYILGTTNGGEDWLVKFQGNLSFLTLQFVDENTVYAGG